MSARSPGSWHLCATSSGWRCCLSTRWAPSSGAPWGWTTSSSGRLPPRRTSSRESLRNSRKKAVAPDDRDAPPAAQQTLLRSGPMATQHADVAAATMARPAATAIQWPFVAAWLFVLVFYFIQYALRSAPGVMIPELSAAFGLTALGLSSLLGLYFYTYAGFAIVAGASLDRYGAKLPIATGLFGVAVGSVLFGLGAIEAAEGGRLLQGAGSAFAFTGAVYLAARGFSDRWLATAVGFTQLAGMLGGFAGQFAVGPLVHGPVGWQSFWIYAGFLLAIVAACILIVTPGRHEPGRGPVWAMFTPYKLVLKNPQSYLCGFVSGLLFMPTNIGDMIWGVPFLREGLGAEAAEAVARSSMVPLGWVIGAPLLGYVADRIGR